MLVGIVAHVNREHLVDNLIRETQADVIRFDDTFPPSVTGCAENHVRVLTELNRHATGNEFVVVLEDDAVPVENFRDQVKSALALSESPLVGLYLGTNSPGGRIYNAMLPAVEAANAADANWIVADWFIGTVAYAVRADWLPALIDSLSNDGGPVDVRICTWSQRAGIETWYSQPSLANHDNGQSLINSVPGFEKMVIRRAWNFGTRDEWSSSAVKMDHIDSDGWF